MSYDSAFAISMTKVSPTGKNYNGTVFPAPNFDAEKDCKDLKAAMKGAGTQEEVITEILTKRSNVQRKEIIVKFKTMYGQDLIDALKSELSGNYENLLLALLNDPVSFDAKSLRKAMAGAGTNEKVLIEIMSTRTNAEISAIKEVYTKMFKRNLEEDLKSETSGYFQRTLISACQGHRQELTPEKLQLVRQGALESVVDRVQAQAEAKELYEAGEKKLGTDESVFIRIFASRNIFQLRAIFDEYERLVGNDILKAIESETSGDFRKMLKSLALSIMDRPLFFARCLQKSMKGLGTDDSTLIRILVSRSEIDLADIKEAFEIKYKKSLAAWIKEDTSGDYKNALLKLLGA